MLLIAIYIVYPILVTMGKVRPVLVIEGFESGGVGVCCPGQVEDSDYRVFGIFRNIRFASVCLDSLPIFLVAMYSLWDQTTRRALDALNSISIEIAEDPDSMRLVSASLWYSD